MKNPIKVYAVILAAGGSSRMGDIDKIWHVINGKPVIGYSIDFFENSKLIDEYLVVTSKINLQKIKEFFLNDESFFFDVIVGGVRRQDSVKLAIDHINSLKEKPDLIVIHDAARPLVTEHILENGIRLAKNIGAAIPVISVKDTIKKISNNLVEETLDREKIFFSQTPQVFSLDSLIAAYEFLNDDITDDAMAIEICGGIVATFPGDEKNLKITHIEDLETIKNLLVEKKSHLELEWTNGIGFDGHKLESGGPLILGGVKITYEFHLEGHSDGDVLLHSICNAILGAASLGDLGQHFPSSDDRYKNIDSSFFIKESMKLITNLGWIISNLDCIIIAEKPKLKKYVFDIENKIKSLVNSPLAQVNVKITSTDGVGAIGEGEGIAAQSIVTLSRTKHSSNETL